MFFKTTSQRKSFAITILSIIIFLFLLSFVGLKYIDPPIEFGMEVNFGFSSDGFGDKVNNTNKDKLNPIEDYETFNRNLIDKNTSVSKNKRINNYSDDLKINKNQNDSLTQPNENNNNFINKTFESKNLEISDNTKSILSNLITRQISTKNQVQGEGDMEDLDDNGSKKGDPYSTIYYGQEGRGGKSIGYGLKGRNLQYQGKEVPKCNESGTVVVRIVVNKNGDVVSAKPGVKGTTNNHPCLMKPAKKTALMHKWFPDKNAPERQIGFVLIQFKIVE